MPIAYGLSFPERIESGAPRLDFFNMQALSFEVPDARRFPGLQLAWDALRGPDGSTAVLNAANEVAVAAFLDGTISFPAIHTLNARTTCHLEPRLSPDHTLEDLIELDTRARAVAHELMRGLAL